MQAQDFSHISFAGPSLAPSLASPISIFTLTCTTTTISPPAFPSLFRPCTIVTAQLPGFHSGLPYHITLGCRLISALRLPVGRGDLLGFNPLPASAYRLQHCGHLRELSAHCATSKGRKMFSWISSTLGYAEEGSGGSRSYARSKAGDEMKWGPGPSHPTAAGPGMAAAAFYHGVPPGGEAPGGQKNAPVVRRRSGRGGGDPPPVSGSIDDVNFFLQQIHRTVQLRHQAMKFTVVMGNEACDLDSMVSAIAYARLLSAKTEENGVPSSCFVPLMAVRREDLALRTEALWLFQSSGLDIDSLIFLNDLDLEELHSRGGLRLILVDHNRLAARQEGLADAVVEIVDHHLDEGLYPHASQKKIVRVGSCSTLVAEKISEEMPELFMGRGLNKLLLAAILVDTGNLDTSLTHCTPQDETMAALLLNGAGHMGRNGFFEKLKERKYDVSTLSTEDLLRKDYKQWTMGPGISGDLGPKGRTTVVGVSSIGLPLQKVLLKDMSAADAIEKFREDRGLDVLVLMTSFYAQGGAFRRELAIVSRDQSLVNRLGAFLASTSAQLSLKANRVGGWEKEGSLPEGSKAYIQGNSQASRKKIQPLLVEFFAN